MLTKRRAGTALRSGPSIRFADEGRLQGYDRRSFLRAAGLTGASLAGLGALGTGAVRKAQAASEVPGGPAIELRHSICTHCSVGCSVIAEVQNGVWVGQEPALDSPINLGTHCAKGAAVREITHGDRRVKYPMKLVGGQWQRLSWEQAIDEIGAKLLKIREESTPEAVFWLGSAKFSNENAYLFRKMAAFWGTNSVDHQARICHSTTVAGVANTLGYGAMTNSFNDLRNSRAIMIMGGNPAEAHPISMQHILRGKEINRAHMIVVDPRFTRTAAHATEYVRLRPGTDIPVVYGVLWHIFKNGWEDKDYIARRVYGMDDVRKEVEKWPPEEVERVSGVPGEQLKRVAEIMSQNKPSTLIWCMGSTQKTVGTANVRAYTILQLALGNIGVPGGGANIFRGHSNVQGATDLGLDVTTLPAYYGLDEAAWRHWARVWDVDFDYLASRFATPELMRTKGIPTTRWFDAVNLPKDQVQQPDRLRAVMVFGHGGNTVVRQPDMMKAIDKLDLVVVCDPHPTTFAIGGNRRDNTYLLPAATQFEIRGTRTNSNRSIQWADEVVNPIFESKGDHETMYLLARRLGFADQMFKHIGVDGTEPNIEDILREINRGTWSIGYTGQSPERLKLHIKHQADFDPETLRATQGPCQGEYYGLPWPCWGSPDQKHPGSPVLYNSNIPVKDGGGGFRARFGVERNGVSMLADGTAPPGSEIPDGYPEFTMAVLRKLGWDADLTPDERAVIEMIGGNDIDRVSWQTDLSGGIQRVAIAHGCSPCGNSKARANAWNLPDPVPTHREPIYTPRTDLLAQYPTRPDNRDFRLPNVGFSVQQEAAKRGIAKAFPMVLTSGRLVEYEGGGEETRSNRWLAELVQEAYAEINPKDAAQLGVKDGQMVWLRGPENESRALVKALVTERVGQGVVFMPFHFGGMFQGENLRAKYPQGADPIVVGESVNTVTTYGYDPVTAMQETKVTLCRVEPA
ncbi:MAG TPA: formate dehydrogenase subunit alpha [Beijerinckiaceae bacterium]|jgi:formate dehydrogenase major subunit